MTDFERTQIADYLQEARDDLNEIWNDDHANAQIRRRVLRVGALLEDIERTTKSLAIEVAA